MLKYFESQSIYHRTFLHLTRVRFIGFVQWNPGEIGCHKTNVYHVCLRSVSLIYIIQNEILNYIVIYERLSFKWISRSLLVQKETHLEIISYKYDTSWQSADVVEIFRNQNLKESDAKAFTNKLNPITDIFNIETEK